MCTPKELVLSLDLGALPSRGRKRNTGWSANQDPKYPRDLPFAVVSASRSCAPFLPIPIVLLAEKKTSHKFLRCGLGNASILAVKVYRIAQKRHRQIKSMSP